jgi:hypothetical protein
VPDGSLFEALQGPAERIGRYFSILSVVPSAVLVLYVRALLASNAWSGPPNWSAALNDLANIGLGESLQLVLLSLMVGLILQPLQYAFVQICEGYWGISRVAQRAMAARIRFHRSRMCRLDTTQAEDLAALVRARESPHNPQHRPVSDGNVEILSRYGEADRVLANYPNSTNDVRPTRLGNVLRRYEAGAGSQYGLSLVAIAPHLILSAPRSHIAYVEDQRTQLDLAVRLVVVGLLGAMISVFLLWRDGLWLLVALVPYSFAYLSYRGAVIVAAEYGTALATVIDLDRFELYEKLHVGRPTSTGAERRRNSLLMRLLTDPRSDAELRYRHPPRRGDDGT